MLLQLEAWVFCYAKKFNFIAGWQGWGSGEGVRNESTRDTQLLPEMLPSSRERTRENTWFQTSLHPHIFCQVCVGHIWAETRESGKCSSLWFGAEQRGADGSETKQACEQSTHPFNNHMCSDTCRQNRKRPDDGDIGCWWQLAKRYHSLKRKDLWAGCLDQDPRKLSSVQSLSRVWLFVTPWTAAHEASLSITNSWSLPRKLDHF